MSAIDQEINKVNAQLAKTPDDQQLKETKAALLNNKAVELSKRERHEEAIKNVNEAIELNPNQATFYCNKANFLQRLNRYPESIECAEQALKTDPSYENARDTLAASLNNQYVIDCEKGSNEEALERINKALELKPNEKVFLSNKASVLNKLSKLDESMELADKALAIDPAFNNPKKIKASILNKLSMADSEEGKNEEALEKVNRAIELNSNEMAFHVNKAVYLVYLNNFKEAGEIADRVLKAEAHNKTAKQIRDIASKNIKAK